MQKYLNYVTVYTFVNIYQDLLIFNNYEHFYYENTSYSLYAIHEYNIYISVGLRYPRTGYPNWNRQFCKELELEIWKKSIPGTESESAQYPKGTRRFLKYDWIAIITLFLVKLANW